MKNYVNFTNIYKVAFVALAIITAVYLYIDHNKKLEIQLVSVSQLVKNDISIPKEEIKVYFNDQKISNFSVLQLRVVNIGSQSIESSDFEKPIRILFKDVERILFVKDVKSNPSDLEIDKEIKDNELVLKKSLLNPADWHSFEIGVVTVSGNDPKIDLVLGRVKGIKEISFENSYIFDHDKKTNWYFVGFICFTMLIALVDLYKVRKKIIKHEENVVKCKEDVVKYKKEMKKEYNTLQERCYKLNEKVDEIKAKLVEKEKGK